MSKTHYFNYFHAPCNSSGGGANEIELLAVVLHTEPFLDQLPEKAHSEGMCPSSETQCCALMYALTYTRRSVRVRHPQLFLAWTPAVIS